MYIHVCKLALDFARASSGGQAEALFGQGSIGEAGWERGIPVMSHLHSKHSQDPLNLRRGPSEIQLAANSERKINSGVLKI